MPCLQAALSMCLRSASNNEPAWVDFLLYIYLTVISHQSLPANPTNIPKKISWLSSSRKSRTKRSYFYSLFLRKTLNPALHFLFSVVKQPALSSDLKINTTFARLFACISLIDLSWPQRDLHSSSLKRLYVQSSHSSRSATSDLSGSHYPPSTTHNCLTLCHSYRENNFYHDFSLVNSHLTTLRHGMIQNNKYMLVSNQSLCVIQLFIWTWFNYKSVFCTCSDISNWLKHFFCDKRQTFRLVACRIMIIKLNNWLMFFMINNTVNFYIWYAGSI